ncbi:unnamed protein product, partial [Linum tenue]
MFCFGMINGSRALFLLLATRGLLLLPLIRLLGSLISPPSPIMSPCRITWLPKPYGCFSVSSTYKQMMLEKFPDIQNFEA